MKRWLALAVLVLAPALASAVALAAKTEDEKAAILAPTGDFSKAEKWEALSGGSATNRRRFGRNAFSQPSDNQIGRAHV